MVGDNNTEWFFVLKRPHLPQLVAMSGYLLICYLTLVFYNTSHIISVSC